MSTGDDFDWQVADRLHSSAIHLLRRLRIQDLASGIGPAKLSALSILVFSERPLSLAELAAAEQVKKPTMSRLVTAMEREELVEIHPSQHDARSIQISPTARGRAALLAGKRQRVASLAKAIRPLSDQQKQELHNMSSLLQEIVRGL